MARRDYQHLDDEALLQFYHSTRNLAAFRLLYNRHKDSLYRYCVQMAPAGASQLLEALWYSVLEQPPRLHSRGLRSWLYIRLNQMLREQPADTNPDDIGEPSTGANPMLGAIQQLPRRQRNILLLHMECQLPLATVADIEGIPLRTCREQYRAGKDSLREILNGPLRQPWRIAEVTA